MAYNKSVKNGKLEQGLSLLGLVVGLWLLYVVARNIQSVELVLIKAGLAGPAVAILLYGIFAPTPVSTDALTLICGALYGPFYGTLVAWMGNNLAALVEYYLGTRICQNMEFEKKKAKLPFGLGKLPINSIPVLTLGRMLPFYGSKIISLLAGMYKVPLKRYVWTSALINLTGAIIYAYGGFKVLDLLKQLMH